MKRVAIVGASDNPERYSCKAFTRLQENGYAVIPVHPVLSKIEKVDVVSSLEKITKPVYAVTLYVRPHTGEQYIEQLIALHPQKIIMNPGTESDTIENRCTEAGITVQRACTLVLLSSGQFES